jgi:hypothetical protein
MRIPNNIQQPAPPQWEAVVPASLVAGTDIMAQAETVQPVTAKPPSSFAATERKDTWWIGPITTGVVLAAFIIYATFRAIFNDFYAVTGIEEEARLGTKFLPGHSYLLSPFYSPLLIFPWLPAWISPAFLILWAPGGFRLTCYYYRKAYYRAFFLDPVGCAVGEPGSYCGIKRGHCYKGETHILLFQNLHRYFMYLALLFLIILAADVIHACIWPTQSGGWSLGVSVGTLVLLANVTLLSLYTFSCHSLRHLVGGRLDSFSRAKFGQARYKLWKWTSVLNMNHMAWAWASLFMVGFADFYVWLIASKAIADFRFF